MTRCPSWLVVCMLSLACQSLVVGVAVDVAAVVAVISLRCVIDHIEEGVKAFDNGRYSSRSRRGSSSNDDGQKLTKQILCMLMAKIYIFDSCYICYNLVVQRKVFSKLDKNSAQVVAVSEQIV